MPAHSVLQVYEYGGTKDFNTRQIFQWAEGNQINR
jgi:hypothetical protein